RLDLEKQALLKFYNAVEKDKSYVWTDSEHTCSWKGVYCDPTNTTVIQLCLPAASLIGEIPPQSIGNLSNLLVLSLRNNKLNGSIPPDFCNLRLTELYLNNNSLSGHLWNINADDLEQLNVSDNSLTCWIPSSLSRFPDSSFSGNPNLYSQTRDRKTIYKRRKQSSSKSLAAVSREVMSPEGERSNKLWYQRRNSRDIWRFFDDGISGLDGDELLLAPTEVLGKGSVATTYKRVLEDKKITVVLKRLIKGVVVPKTEFESHMEVLGKMKNENVVPLRGYCYSEDEKWLVYDFMNGGSLSAHLHGSIGLSERGLKWDSRRRIALSAGKGVAYLHAHSVVHGNIKSSNILLQQEANNDFVVKVSDYGLNTLFEVVKTQDFSLKSDVYSFGVLLLELLTGKAPNYQPSAACSNEFLMWVQSVVCEEPKIEIFDIELRRDQNIPEMFHMLRIAKDCVSIVADQRPTMPKVVSMMEEMNPVEIDDWFRQLS
ncbi:hypothetical protein M8C21_015740, partial [Ambrosia artemisiifolia]